MRLTAVASVVLCTTFFSCHTPDFRGLPEAVVKSIAEGIVDRLEKRIPADLYAALDAEAPIEAFALYPYPEDLAEDDEAKRLVKRVGRTLHGYPAIGYRALERPEHRRKMASTFAIAVVQKQNDAVADCFEPRHGMRIVHDGVVHELVICFACEQALHYVNGVQKDSVLVAESPDAMNAFYKELGLKVDGED